MRQQPGATRGVQPPGPRGLPIVGVLPMIAKDPFGYLASLQKRYGDVIKVPLPSISMIMVNHPDHIQRILVQEAAKYQLNPALKDAVTDLPYLPPFFATLHGDPWRRVRRLLNPKFSNRTLGSTNALIAEAIWDGVESWDEFADAGKVIDIQHELHMLAMAVLLRSMFSRPADRATVEQAVHAFEENARGMALSAAFSWLPGWAPKPYQRRRVASSKWIAGYIDALVAERRANPTDSDDLLNLLLNASFEDGTKMDDMQIRAELRGLLFAGFETTATALAWTFAKLCQHPDALALARAEVNEHLGTGRPLDGALPEMPWLRACFEEAQRMQSNSMTVLSRRAAEDDVIDGYRIPAGAIVGWSATALYNDERFWTQPERFDPNRFLSGDVERYAFPLFSFGQRRCLGINFAYLEGVQVMAAVLQRFDVSLDPQHTVTRQHNFGAARVKGGLPVTLRRRTQSRA
ncbi:cytochrome P450 [Mycolicibacillus koreensis]|nr:cytochrome P450 [Mycolicibacillus koreensis]